MNPLALFNSKEDLLFARELFSEFLCKENNAPNIKEAKLNSKFAAFLKQPDYRTLMGKFEQLHQCKPLAGMKEKNPNWLSGEWSVEMYKDILSRSNPVTATLSLPDKEGVASTTFDARYYFLGLMRMDEQDALKYLCDHLEVHVIYHDNNQNIATTIYQDYKSNRGVIRELVKGADEMHDFIELWEDKEFIEVTFDKQELINFIAFSDSYLLRDIFIESVDGFADINPSTSVITKVLIAKGTTTSEYVQERTVSNKIIESGDFRVPHGFEVMSIKVELDGATIELLPELCFTTPFNNQIFSALGNVVHKLKLDQNALLQALSQTS